MLHKVAGRIGKEMNRKYEEEGKKERKINAKITITSFMAKRLTQNDKNVLNYSIIKSNFNHNWRDFYFHIFNWVIIRLLMKLIR